MKYIKLAGCDFTEKQHDLIKDNLISFLHNFKNVTIVKDQFNPGFYVFVGNVPADCSGWLQYCYNIDYLNGWLYGCVQAKHRKELKDNFTEGCFK